MWWLLWIACRAPTGAAPGEAPPSTTASDTSPDTSSTVRADTAVADTAGEDTGATGPVFDCATVPTRPSGFRTVPGARGYHDVAFDLSGGIIGIGTGFRPDLIRADDQGDSAVFLPQVGTLEQFVWLPDGDLAVASLTEGLQRIRPNGAKVFIAPDVRSYGLILGPDGLLYAADQERILRVDPDDGAVEEWLPRGSLPQGTPRVIAFDLDYASMYIGTFGGSGGRLYRVAVDAALNPAGPVTVFASGVGTGAYHDAIGVDVCGFLYVPDYSTSALFKVSPSGDVERYLEADGFVRSPYGHGVEWGNGIGAWRADAIYVPQPYSGNEVMEIVVGVPGRDGYVGRVVNRP